ncbi:MBL fold metallo-hydrolase [Fusibacter paucivorans]|uniref:MBL fold metallo-hydrolase n=1 Tax=Fusibacter paucivorans TaxID=76009 RepID=A0ABS5PNX3_9FIRM|nr:MBL fold metallo-hydrolase [Fusibacter paucivorans]MBS7526868.1 MBL fold metallo-hydrolase [Fusibacter paucivorans]
MRIRSHQNVYQLTYWPNLFPINVYIVEYDDHLILVDTGIQAMVTGILNFADQLAKPIRHILITHCHGDHIGGLEALKKALPNAAFYVSKRESRLFDGDFSVETHEPQQPIKGGIPKHKISYDITLEDGDHIEGICCISIPGHTPGQMAYYVEAAGILLVGDALQSRGGLAVAGTINWTFPFPALATWSKPLAVKSAELILALSPEVIGCGHGDMIHNPTVPLTQAINRSKTAR